jgi:hypothetical protein
MTQSGLSARRLGETDHVPEGAATVPVHSIDPTPALGQWLNTNRRTWGITRAEVTQRDGQIWLQVWAADPEEGPRDWGTVPVERLYADGPSSNRVAAYQATFDLGHARTLVQANITLGVAILAAFTTFTDDSGRVNYMSREYFHRI